MLVAITQIHNYSFCVYCFCRSVDRCKVWKGCHYLANKPPDLFSFLNDRDIDQAAFEYTPTDEASALKFICTKKTKSIPYNNRAIVNLTFVQVFEP